MSVSVSSVILKVAKTYPANIHIDTLYVHKDDPQGHVCFAGRGFFERGDFYSRGAGKIRVAEPSCICHLRLRLSEESKIDFGHGNFMYFFID